MCRDPSSPPGTEAESVVMEVLWRHNPVPTEAVVTALEGEQHWQEGTIKALLNRLLKEEGHSRRQGWPPVSVIRP